MLPGLEHHPHARAILGAACEAGAEPSHAYLFEGPAGTGKAEVARAFASALLAPRDSEAAGRVERGTHPDLVWVRPSGAAEMLVSDIDEPVVLAATRTPFEAERRVFVLEDADAMNDAAANRMLKTLEEPAAHVHLLLLSARPAELLETIRSRCQSVRFDALPVEEMARRLQLEGASAEAAAACARLALGDGRLARELIDGRLRAAAQTLACGDGEHPWQALLTLSAAQGQEAAAQLDAAHAERLELAGKSDKKRLTREHAERSKRAVRRAGARARDKGLSLTGLWFRDAAVVLDGAPELVHAADRLQELKTFAAGRTSSDLRGALGLVERTRHSLALNVNEELALEALSYRLSERA